MTRLLTEARSRTLALASSLSDEDLRRQHSPLMSPIVWDLGHIAHFEEVWLLETLDGPGAADGEGLRGIYDPFGNPRAGRDELALPSREEARAYLATVRRAVLDALDAPRSGPAAPGLLQDGFVYRMVLQHEYQHNETILQTLQLKQGRPWAAVQALTAPQTPDPGSPEPGTMVRLPGGVVEHGTDDRSAAYDNERPLHRVTLEPFWMDAHPVTCGEYRAFMDDGGYRRRELWSEAGWAHRREMELDAPAYWTETGQGWTVRYMDRTVPLNPSEPVCHVGYWEADAYARWADKRLPTEFEWEAAATWDAEGGAKQRYPWGDDAPDARRANLDGLLYRPVAVGSYPLGVSPSGCWGMMGDVWEWTSTEFHGYPDYRTFPYPEYSEVFFADGYRVLRGGSWATRYGAVRGTFRNWDHPIRRQIFSGFRCARHD